MCVISFERAPTFSLNGSFQGGSIFLSIKVGGRPDSPKSMLGGAGLLQVELEGQFSNRELGGEKESVGKDYNVVHRFTEALK